jgi:hypothetical protein
MKPCASAYERREHIDVKMSGLRENPEIPPLDRDEARFLVRRCDSATGRHLRSAFIGRSKAAPQWSENGQHYDLSYNVMFL